MSRNPEYPFVQTDADVIEEELVASYEEKTGRALHPADPERLFLSWIAAIILRERAAINRAGNQNLPSRAEGEALDALGQWIYGIPRPAPAPAGCTLRFHIAVAQKGAVTVPGGTRVTTAVGGSAAPVFATTADAVI